MARFDFEYFMDCIRREAGEGAKPESRLQTLKKFITIEDEAFVEYAYRKLLARKPDLKGYLDYNRYSTTITGRLRIWLSLYYAQESTKKSEKWAQRIRKIKRILRFGKNKPR